MLPDHGGQDDSTPDSARYGAFAMQTLVEEILRLGGRRQRLEAKVFGGGNVLRGLSQSNVGERNAQFVMSYLATEKIPVVARDLGGTQPRKVYQFVKDGRVRVKRLGTMANDTVFERERDYRSRLVAEPVGEVELFG